MGRYIDCFVVLRGAMEDDGIMGEIQGVMAVYPDEEGAKEAIDELYRDDYEEFRSLSDADTYEEYMECPVNYYFYTKKPMFVKTSDSYQRVNIIGGTTVSSVTETVHTER